MKFSFLVGAPVASFWLGIWPSLGGERLLWSVNGLAALAQISPACLRDAILAHPTMAEGLGLLFANVPAGIQQALTGVKSH